MLLVFSLYIPLLEFLSLLFNSLCQFWSLLITFYLPFLFFLPSFYLCSLSTIFFASIYSLSISLSSFSHEKERERKKNITRMSLIVPAFLFFSFLFFFCFHCLALLPFKYMLSIFAVYIAIICSIMMETNEKISSVLHNQIHSFNSLWILSQ